MTLASSINTVNYLKTPARGNWLGRLVDHVADFFVRTFIGRYSGLPPRDLCRSAMRSTGLGH